MFFMMKDNKKAMFINELTEVAREYAGTQQLRERLKTVVMGFLLESVEEAKIGRNQIKKAQALEEKGGELEGFIAQIRMPDGSLANVDKHGRVTWNKFFIG